MSDAFYAEMAGVATELLGEFKQGTVTLTRVTPGTPNPETPWIVPAPTTVTYTLDAVAAAVTVDHANAKYIDGTVITTADLVVTCSTMAVRSLINGEAADGAVVAIAPQMTDVLTLDGAVRQIKKIVQIPAVGTPVAFKIFVQG